MQHAVTIFKDIHSVDTPFYRDVMVCLRRIKEGSSQEIIKRIRKSTNKAERNDLKKTLPSICYSGTFKRRDDSSIIEHSGLICLDFDKYDQHKALLEDKESLTKDKYVFSVFISPSGNGLKVLIRIPQDPENHLGYFGSLANHFNNEHLDRASKNLSRACWESYDPLIYINPNSLIYEDILEPEYKECIKSRDIPTIPITDENKIVDILVRWWEKKFPMSEGQRNENAFKLAMAFNDYGVSRSLASHILRKYVTKDFPTSEVETTINSAYAHRQNFGTKYYEDEERVNVIRSKMRRGVSKKEIRVQLQDGGLDSSVADNVIMRVEAELANKTFWTKSDKGVVRVDHISFKQFLEDSGFYKYCPEASKNYVFVKVTNNLIDHASEKEIKDFILSHLMDLDDVSVYNYFADNTRFFKDEFLSMLSTINIFFIEDSKECAYLYYKNCAVMVEKDKVTPIDYLDLGGYVWKNHVIDRNFSIVRVSELCDYKQFISNICGADEERIKAMETTIGFLLHGYKNLSFCPAVILNDEVISDNPEGGTGKGIFMNALGHMKKLVVIDGKSFQFERTFAYQLVSADTQILCFDDAKKHFDFERLFSVVSEGLTLEKKNKDAIHIPFRKSPKIAITTNYAIKGSGNSFVRRKWELELHQYYSREFTPIDEFGKLLFGDWSEEEWCEFDNYMISCLQKHLELGLVKSKFVNLSVRQLSAETSHEFIEWCGLLNGVANDKLNEGIQLKKQDLYYDFIDEYPDYAPRGRLTISRTRFYKWLFSYAVFKTGMTPEEGRDVTGRWMVIRAKK